MQEYMQSEIQKQGLSHVFLSLYLNGDNLYPNIRFSPPIYGESVVDSYGYDGKWYRYWSDKTKQSMVEHVQGLLNCYEKNNTRIIVKGEEKLPLCSMWDPIVAPSFDKEGRQRYLAWLMNSYHSIKDFNAAYHTNVESFESLTPKEYWFSCCYEEDMCYALNDVKEDNTKYQMWIDNIKWKKDELVLYFEDMHKRLKKIREDLYLSPMLTQWSHFFNVDGSKLSNVGFSELWDTAMRGIDIYELAPFVDVAHFITVPITPLGDPNPYVVSIQHSMMRCMNEGREFLGGIYWGRFLYQHIYEYITPCEVIGSMVGCGISGYSSYGMCGLDDGGVLHRMEESFLNSLSIGNKWAKKVIPLLKGKIKPKIALLFPNAMAAYEPMSVEGNVERRYDLLGFYQSCLDLGYEVDVIDINKVAEGKLKDYKVLIIPCNQSYKKDRSKKAEKNLKDWVKQGGILLHGPSDDLVKKSIHIKGITHEKDEINYYGGVLVQGDVFEYFEGSDILVEYQHSHKGAVVYHSYNEGGVYSFGFLYGSNYAAKIAPHVPLSQKNNELYPIPYMKCNIIKDILIRYVTPSCCLQEKNIEVSNFENGLVITNHTSTPISIDKLIGEKHFQYQINDYILLPRSSVCIITE